MTKPPSMPIAMTPDQFVDTLRPLVERIGAEFKAVRAEMAALKALRADVEQLKTADAMRFRDVWRRSQRYVRGDVTLHGGQLWFACVESTSVQPGDGNTCWTLMTKR